MEAGNQQQYVAVKPIRHNGELTEPGQPFECDAAEMKRLLEAGAVALVAPAPAEGPSVDPV